MTVEGGFFVQPAVLDEIAAAAARVADGVRLVGDAVAKVPTTPPEHRGEWLLGDMSIDLVAPWYDVLYAQAAGISTLGQNMGKASKLYSSIDERLAATLRDILP